MQILAVLIVLGVAIAIFLTTPVGKKISARFGLRIFNQGLASNEDHDYLLRVCNGDFDELSARLKAARGFNPELSEAEVYRRAIRSHLRNKM